uniref:FBD domain-containing protein n=1 Tax=Steinernema glaseri TaxID=37863 RepID=A0A1I7YI55_9BILA
MDTVPIAFWEHMCDVLDGTLWEVGKLSGNLGKFALLHNAGYEAEVANGVERNAHLFYMGRTMKTLEEFEAVPKKRVRRVSIQLFDDEEENVTRSLSKRFPRAVFDFFLESPSINEALVDVVCSLKRLGSISLTTELDDHAVSLFQKIVASRKISELTIDQSAGEGDTLEVTKSILCQDQFKELEVSSGWLGEESDESDESDVVLELLEFWSENSKELIGKSLTLNGDNCECGVRQLEEFLLHRAPGRSELKDVLKMCSQEECDFIFKEYPRNRANFTNSSAVYKFEEGDGCERRRLYVSFECGAGKLGGTPLRPANHSKVNDLSLIRKTHSLRVLFAVSGSV